MIDRLKLNSSEQICLALTNYLCRNSQLFSVMSELCLAFDPHHNPPLDNKSLT